jgi:hypothetical protein
VGRHDWYRKTTWTGPDQSDFWEHFERARSPHSKSQYLSVQAIHLRDTGKRELITAAVKLLEKCVADYSDQQFEMQRAYHTLASCHALLNQNDVAASAFLKALEARRAMPHFQGDAHIDLALFAIVSDLTELFPAAEAALLEFGSESPFPLDVYRFQGALAVLSHARGDQRAAREHALLALEASERKESGFRYHQSLGLVGDKDRNSRFHKRLETIAGRANRWVDSCPDTDHV